MSSRPERQQTDGVRDYTVQLWLSGQSLFGQELPTERRHDPDEPSELPRLLWPTRYSIKLKQLFAARFEGLIDRLCVFRTDGDLLILLTKLLLHERKRVIAGRQTLDFVLAIL